MHTACMMTTTRTVDDAVSEAVRARMARALMTQGQLAALTGIPRNRISQRVSGRSSGWRLDELANVARALDVPLATLIDEVAQ